MPKASSRKIIQGKIKLKPFLWNTLIIKAKVEPVKWFFFFLRSTIQVGGILPNYGRQIVQGQKSKVGRDEHQRSVRPYKGIGYPLKGDKKVRPSIRRWGYYFSSSGLRCQCEVYTLRESGLRCSVGLWKLWRRHPAWMLFTSSVSYRATWRTETCFAHCISGKRQGLSFMNRILGHLKTQEGRTGSYIKGTLMSFREY